MTGQDRRFGATFQRRNQSEAVTGFGVVESVESDGVVLVGESESVPFLGSYSPQVDDVVCVQRVGSGGAVVLGAVITAEPEAQELTITADDWENFGGIYQPPTVSRSGRIVALSGLVKATVDPGENQILFTLDAQFRPAKQFAFFAFSNTGTQVQVNVGVNGTVTAVDPGGTVAYMPLDFTWVV